MKISPTTLSAGLKLLVFSVVSLLVTGTLVAIMGNVGGGATEDYTAVFSSASLLQEGDDVRVAGVTVGQVRSVEVVDRDKAEVRFSFTEELPLTEASRVEIRYLNLVGDRYLAVLEGRPGAPEIEPGETIPMERTTPALNLTALYNGFAPLFAALEPEDVNELTLNLVRVLQGEGGTIESLLDHTASLTAAIADRDQLVGEVIANLDELLTTVDSRHRQLTTLLTEMRRWVGGLAEDRVQIGRSIVHVSRLTSSLAALLSEGRPLLKADIRELRRLSEALSTPEVREVLAQVLRDLPEMLEDQTRTGTYGSWYNYYVCWASAEIKLPDELRRMGLQDLHKQLRDIRLESRAERCNR